MCTQTILSFVEIAEPHWIVPAVAADVEVVLTVSSVLEISVHGEEPPPLFVPVPILPSAKRKCFPLATSASTASVIEGSAKT